MLNKSFLGFLIFFMGLISAISPELIWFISEGWKFKEEVEPSDAYLIFTRIFGFITMIASVFISFM